MYALHFWTPNIPVLQKTEIHVFNSPDDHSEVLQYVIPIDKR